MTTHTLEHGKTFSEGRRSKKLIAALTSKSSMTVLIRTARGAIEPRNQNAIAQTLDDAKTQT